MSALIGLGWMMSSGIPNARADEMPAAGKSLSPEAAEHAHHHHHATEQAVTQQTASYQIPDVTLVDQSGRTVSLRTLLRTDRPVMLNFIYTSCTAICPVMTGTFAQVQDRLGKDIAKVRMVSISIDPEHDTSAELARYAKKFNAGPQWLFLTGKIDDIVAVQRAFDAFRGDKMNHAPLTLMRASPKTEWVRYDGFASSAQLAHRLSAMLGS